MKKYIFSLLLGSAMCSLSAQHIADSNFVQAIKWQCPTCIDTANNLTAVAQSVRTITLSNNITDLTGIHGFSSLSALNCADNNLTRLPTLPANLRTLHCSNNKLTALPTLPTTLSTLYCRSNQLLSLPTLPPNMLLLDCSNNKINKIPALPFTLKNFYCSYNEIFTLPYLPGSITDMGCSNNFIAKLPDLPPFLIFLSCFNNTALTCLPTLPDSLLYIEVSPTITCLPNAIKKLNVFQYDGQSFKIATLPICSAIKPNPCATTAIGSINLDNRIRIFPSITEGVVFIDSDGLIVEQVLIFNRMGQIMAQSKSSQLDLSAFSSGLYFIQVIVGGGRVVRKVVKQ